MGHPIPPDSNSLEAEDELKALHTDSNLPDPDIMIWSTEEENNQPVLQTPPPHIAQRFWRSNTNRRRSSNASSRRNSMTSSHSHHSNKSFRTALTRNSIAQHLRRASILEDRKTRLQNQAAHAEQVRSRAAQAKAAPRGNNSEEKAVAAELARKKHLAKVAAACADEVNRSRKIAEENKERKAAEERRCKQELEDKHAEAERRRLEYKRTPRRMRTISQVHAEDAKPIRLRRVPVPTQNEACLTIQRTWRKSQRRKVVTSFQELDLTIERISQIPVEEAQNLLMDSKVIIRTQNLLHLMNLEAGGKNDDKPVKRFLIAYMMLGHPNETFQKDGEQEQDLIGKAKDLLICFESILSEYTSSASVVASDAHLLNLNQSHTSFLTSFDAWKKGDATVFIETMVDQFVALDAIWQTVKDDSNGDAASEYRDGIRNNQLMMYTRIRSMTGVERADALIKRAIKQSRRKQSTRGPVGDVRPRQLATQDPTPSDQSTQDQGTASPFATEANRQGSGQQDEDRTDLSRVFSVIPSNRALVHELMIDANFRVESSPQSDLKSMLNREICDNMRRGVTEGQTEIWTLAVAENIRTRLLKLLRSGNSLHNLLSEVLDSSHIQQQCRNGLFSYDKFFIFMADLLPRLCAPFRDTEVQNLASTLKEPTENADAMIEKLFGLLHVIDCLALDHTNYLIRQQAPVLIPEGPGYEQRMFQQDLDGGQVQLDRTTRWWRNASMNVVTESSIHDAQTSARPPSFTRSYARGLTDLVVGFGSVRDADIPETLLFDTARLGRLRADITRFVTVGGVLMTVKNLLKRDLRSQWKPEAKRLFEALQGGYADPTGDLCARILAIVESGHGMPASSKDVLASQITRFLAEGNSGQLRNPVLKVLLQRLKSHLYERLAAQSSSERLRVASMASSGLATNGLGEFIGQISACADELGMVMQVDVQTHGVWLRRIAEEADGLGTRQAPGPS